MERLPVALLPGCGLSWSASSPAHNPAFALVAFDLSTNHPQKKWKDLWISLTPYHFLTCIFGSLQTTPYIERHIFSRLGSLTTEYPHHPTPTDCHPCVYPDDTRTPRASTYYASRTTFPSPDVTLCHRLSHFFSERSVTFQTGGESKWNKTERRLPPPLLTSRPPTSSFPQSAIPRSYPQSPRTCAPPPLIFT